MKHILSPFLFILLFLPSAFAQEVIFPVTNFSTKDYGREFHPQNWAVVQDQRGMMYFANGFKLIGYDGHSWSSYPINRETMILSLGIDDGGFIYAGSQNEFGRFLPDAAEGLKYYSLSDSLEPDDMMFSNIRYIHILKNGVAFLAEEKLFLFNNNTLKVIDPETSFHTSFAVNDILYVRQRGYGLMELKDEKLQSIEGGDIFASAGIFMMLPYGGGGRILIGTREMGFWLYDPEGDSGKFYPFKINEQKIIDESAITGGSLLSGDRFALSTLYNGIIVLDKEGNIVSIINKDYGLADNDVKHLITDRDNNLWLALENGISMIQTSSPLSFYSGRSGIEGTVQSVARHNGLLHAGTTAGLFVQTPGKHTGTQFAPAAISDPVRSLIGIDDLLLAGTDAGIFEIRNSSVRKISSERSSTLCYSPVFNLLLSGGSGLSAYQTNGSYRKITLPADIRSDIVAISERKRESRDTCEIWVGTRYDGTIRLIFGRDLKCSVDKYTSLDGLSAGPVMPFSHDNEIVFGTIDGLYTFIGESIVRETLPDSLKNDPDFARGYFQPFSISADTIGRSVSILADTPENIWICADNELGYINKTDYNQFVRAPFRGIDAGKINTIYPGIDGICWFGTSDGLVRYDMNSGKDYLSGFLTIIRKVASIRTDSILFAGLFFTGDESGIRITDSQPANLKPGLEYRYNSLRFEFAAPFYEYPGKTLFSCRLEGYDTSWSAWENKYYQEYTNLHEGTYTFHVKARNVYGQTGGEAKYSFTILPPWYRSPLAYFLYLVASLALVWVIIRIYTMRLKRENIRLEGIVRERTAEVVRQRDLLEYQKKEIEDSIRYASRIQSAVLPADPEFTSLVPDSFVFFRPRDIVSGDFYWISRIDGKLIISAADCTGHGVPGAFMSMLGVAFLDEIVNKDHILKPGEILNRLRQKVIEALQQQGVSGEAKDGMDIVVVSIDEKEGKLQFAGAYNPLIMIRNGELSEYRGDRMPIAIFERMRDFTVHEIPIEKGDLIYFSSDGYEDQFGGPEGKKFKVKQFRELLLEICNLPMMEQKETIIRRYEEWKGEMNQVDDIVVIGIRIQAP